MTCRNSNSTTNYITHNNNTKFPTNILENLIDFQNFQNVVIYNLILNNYSNCNI